MCCSHANDSENTARFLTLSLGMRSPHRSYFRITDYQPIMLVHELNLLDNVTPKRRELGVLDLNLMNHDGSTIRGQC
jgi:hypothetical protein